MDLAPTQGVASRPMDTVVLNGHRELSMRLVYEDGSGEQQERTFSGILVVRAADMPEAEVAENAETTAPDADDAPERDQT